MSVTRNHSFENKPQCNPKMAKNLVRQIPAKIKGYVKENWGAPFIIVFMVLLVIAAAVLSLGLSSLADEVAVYGYYALTVGVILQLVCFLKYNKRNSEKINGSS
jgi:heme/copper-type cytochrome/quinol oxidase subunit 4